MLNAIVVSIRFILLVLAGQKQVAFENVALRQQLAVFKRNVPRPKLSNRDRSTLMHFHKMLTKPKYRMLFSPCGWRIPEVP